MFQRQLSTNALNATGSGATDAPAAHSAAQGRGRIFQRQMTASQLMTTSGPAAQEAARQRAAALLASVRANAADQAASSGAAAQTRPLVGARAAASKEAAADESQQVSSAAAAAGSACATAAPAKRAPKQKRIISRMLSISAIHATVGSSSSNSSTGNLNSSGNNVEPGEPSARSTSLAASAASQHASSTNALNDTTAGYAMPPNAAPVRPEMAADQVAGGLISDHTSSDKFDSSFVRSRSSSASSATAQWQQQQQQQQQHQQQQSANELNATAHTTASESIQCVAFIDTPAVQAAAGATSGLHAGGVTAAAAAASSGCSHKSLASSSIDSQGGSPLALCLGTSVGSVLLINLTLPDNEDNRVLQLQSVNAEPMPQASLKLPGSILCITMFACEPRNPASSTSSAAQSASAGSTSGPAESSGLSTSGDLSAGAADPNRATSGDSRAVQFLAIVSEKQARVYHLSNCYSSAQSASSPPPQGSSLASGAAPANASQGSIANESTCAASAAHSSFARDAISTPSPSQVQCAPLQSSASSKHPIERNSSTEGPFAKLFAANNANLFSRCDLSESSFVCRSAVVQMRAPGSIDEHCLASYLATGNVLVHTLPRLAAQPIMDADFVPYSNARIASSMQFSRLGHCLYQPSGTEVCKFTISAQYKALVNDMTGALYVAREMPEMPRPNFFKSLLSSVSGAGATSSAKQQSERDELFGELGAGRAQRGVAKHIGASSSSTLDKLKGAAVGTMGHEMRMAREGLDERGEKLSEVEDRTQHMMMQSEVYANAAHQLAQKFKDKKWYQF